MYQHPFYFISYVHSLYTYLLSFLSRTAPLSQGQVQAAMKPVEEAFEKNWKEGKVEGWQKKSSPSSASKEVGSAEGIWCPACELLAWHLMTDLSLGLV